MNLIENNRVRLDYDILEEFEAGLVLFGYEARSLRDKRGSLKGARVVVRGGEAYLVGASIPAWQPANAPKSYDPERPRKLLLSKKELIIVADAEGAAGLTIVPIVVYNKGRYQKIRIAVARGKKKYDKREDLKKKDDARRNQRIARDK
jgi:SsrA-binding protein